MPSPPSLLSKQMVAQLGMVKRDMKYINILDSVLLITMSPLPFESYYLSYKANFLWNSPPLSPIPLLICEVHPKAILSV